MMYFVYNTHPLHISCVGDFYITKVPFVSIFIQYIKSALLCMSYLSCRSDLGSNPRILCLQLSNISLFKTVKLPKCMKTEEETAASVRMRGIVAMAAILVISRYICSGVIKMPFPVVL